MKLVVTLVLGVLLSMLPRPVEADAAAAAPDPTFTWPQFTTFNPLAHAYEFSVSGDGQYPYYVTSERQVLKVSGPGTYVFDFPSGYTEREWLRVTHCDESACRFVTGSPRLTLVASLHTGWAFDTENPPPVGASGGVRQLGYWLSPMLPGVRLEWVVTRVGAPISRALASGEVIDPAPEGTLSVTIPPGLADGRYLLRLKADLDGGELLGHLVGTSDDVSPEVWIRVDGVAPKVHLRVPADQRTIYPLIHRYDVLPTRVQLEYGADEEVSGTVTFRGPGGIVDQFPISAWAMDSYFTWSARRGRDVLPAGRYAIVLDLADAAGNHTVVKDSVAVSHAVYRVQRSRWQLGAAPTLVGADPGPCGAVTRPSAHGWSGSVGLVPDARCRRPDAHVTVVHRVYLPRSYRGSYSSFKLAVHGAAAPSRPGSRAVAALVTTRGRTVDPVVVPPRRGWFTITQTGLLGLLRRDAAGRYYVLCAVAAAGNDRYDLEGFRASVHYGALGVEDPGRSGAARTGRAPSLQAPIRLRTASDANTIAEPSGAPGPGYTLPKTDAAELLEAYSPST